MVLDAGVRVPQEQACCRTVVVIARTPRCVYARAVDEEVLRRERAQVERPGRRAVVQRRVDLAEDDERLVVERGRRRRR